MKLSVIIPIYNGELFIKDLVSNLNAITYRDFEVVFIDNNSTDQSVILLQNELSHAVFGFQLLYEFRQGSGYARNTGISQAKGKYIAFLDCDDQIHPDKYARDIDYLEQYDVDFVFCRTERKYSNGRTIKHPIDGFKEGINHPPDLGILWLKSFFSLQGTGAIMINKVSLEKLSGFHTMRTGQDAFLFIRMGLVCKGYFYNDVMFFYNRHTNSTVSKRNKEQDGTLISYFNLRKELFLDTIIQSNVEAYDILKNQLTVDLLKLHRKGYKTKDILKIDLQKKFTPSIIVWNFFSLLINRNVLQIKYNPFFQFWNRFIKK